MTIDSFSKVLRIRSPEFCVWVSLQDPKAKFGFRLKAATLDKNVSDERLMEMFQKGDAKAFEEILTRHKNGVYNFIYRFLGDFSILEDTFQEIFLRIIKGAEGYKKEAKFTTWLYTIARNYCIDMIRKKKYRNEISLDESIASFSEGEDKTLMDLIPNPADHPHEDVCDKEISVYIQKALEAISPEQREVFVMREFLSLSFIEIAEIIKCPENTVKSRMRYALLHLRKILEGYKIT